MSAKLNTIACSGAAATTGQVSSTSLRWYSKNSGTLAGRGPTSPLRRDLSDDSAWTTSAIFVLLAQRSMRPLSAGLRLSRATANFPAPLGGANGPEKKSRLSRGIQNFSSHTRAIGLCSRAAQVGVSIHSRDSNFTQFLYFSPG